MLRRRRCSGLERSHPQLSSGYHKLLATAFVRPPNSFLDSRMRWLIGFIALPLLTAQERADESLFKDRVAGVLEQRCVSCHNNDTPKGGLSLQSLEKAIKGGESGSAVTAGEPDES